MTSAKKESWLLRNKKRLRILSRFRFAILKSAHLLGGKLAQRAINLGYLIKTSQFFREATVEIMPTRSKLYEKVASEYGLADEEMVYLEFGVYKGTSFKFWLEKNLNPNSGFYGFDTFSGLPEDWGHIPKGHFNTEGQIPIFDDNRYNFYKGLFHDTLPPFLTANKERLSKKLIINLDADLYSSTLYVLINISGFLKKGDILLFDEFFSVVNASTEFRAFLDFLAINSIKLHVVAKTTTHCIMVVE
jgi:O-methyltransferase